MTTLDDLAHTVSNADDTENLVRPLLKLVERITGLESSYLTTIDLESGLQTVVYSQNSNKLRIPENLTIPWEDTLCKRALEEQRPYTEDVPGRWGDSKAAGELGIKTYVSQPIITIDGSLYGTLCAASRSSVPASSSMLDSLSLIAGIIAYQIDRERTVKFLSASNVLLLTQSSQDPLTGVANRRELLSRLEVMLKQAQNTGQSIGILFIDLDNFKLINDQYGHDIGDLFLIEVASRLGSVLRPEDIIARYGGDEFVIAALGVDPVALKERLMHVTIGTYNLAEFSIMYAGPSIGVTQTKEDELDPVSVLARADQAMYEIKKSRKTQTK